MPRPLACRRPPVTRPPDPRTRAARGVRRWRSCLVAVVVVAGGAYLLLGRDDGPTARDAADGVRRVVVARRRPRAPRSRRRDPSSPRRRWRPTAVGSTARSSRASVRRRDEGRRRRRPRPAAARMAGPAVRPLRLHDPRRAPPRRRRGLAVVWDPRLVHPALDRRDAARDVGRPPGARADPRPRRPPARDRAGGRARRGRAQRVKDVDATAAAVAKVVDIDAADVREGDPQRRPAAVRRGGQLRADEFDAEAGRARGDRRACRRSRTPRAGADEGASPARVLGTVGPVTAEQLERLGPAYGPGAQVGQFGLEARYEKQLAGDADAARSSSASNDGAADDTLAARRGTPGRAVRTTLDRDVQTAAETGARRQRARRPRSSPCGRRPATSSRSPTGPTNSSFDRALGGRYPPGLDVQDRQHGRAAARRPEPGRDGRVPADDQRRRAHVQELRGRGERRRPVQPGLRAVVQHRVREPLGPPAGRRPASARRSTSASAARSTCR